MWYEYEGKHAGQCYSIDARGTHGLLQHTKLNNYRPIESRSITTACSDSTKPMRGQQWASTHRLLSLDTAVRVPSPSLPCSSAPSLPPHLSETAVYFNSSSHSPSTFLPFGFHSSASPNLSTTKPAMPGLFIPLSSCFSKLTCLSLSVSLGVNLR